MTLIYSSEVFIYFQNNKSPKIHKNIQKIKCYLYNTIRVFEFSYKLYLRGSVKNNWELSYISKTMKRNLFKELVANCHLP